MKLYTVNLSETAFGHFGPITEGGAGKNLKKNPTAFNSWYQTPGDCPLSSIIPAAAWLSSVPAAVSPSLWKKAGDDPGSQHELSQNNFESVDSRKAKLRGVCPNENFISTQRERDRHANNIMHMICTVLKADSNQGHAFTPTHSIQLSQFGIKELDKNRECSKRHFKTSTGLQVCYFAHKVVLKYVFGPSGSAYDLNGIDDKA